MNLQNEIKNYIPKNIQEQTDKEAMLFFIKNNDNYLVRDNLIAHFTSSAIVVNEDITKVLFAHHNIYNSWAWVGGHNDGVEDCLEVAIKEAKEETGLTTVTPLHNDIAGIDVIYVMPHMKRGKHISDHLHLNVTYILQASEQDTIVHKEDENSGVKWFDFDEVLDIIDEPRMKPIYQKLINVAKTYGKNHG